MFGLTLKKYKIKRLAYNWYHTAKVSAGAINPAGGEPVCGSVPFALLKSNICGYGLCN